MKRKKFAWTLPEAIERRLGDTTYGRQRAMFEEGHLLLILHAPPGPDEDERAAVVFLRKPDGEYLCNGKPQGEAKLRRLLSDYRERFEALDKEYQRSKTAKDFFELIEAAAPLNRSSTHMEMALQSAREAVPDDPFLIAMRDEAYETSRSFDLLLSDSRAAVDYRIARNAEEQAAKSHEMTVAQHKLNVLAAVTFPLMAIATLLGMNLTHGFEDKSPYIYYGVLVAGLIVGLAVVAWVTAKAGKTRRDE